MLASQQGSPGVRMMQMVRRSQMDDVNLRITQHFLERSIGPRDAQLCRFFPGLFLCSSHQPKNMKAVAAQAFHMGWPNKTGACHANADGLFGELFFCHEYSQIYITTCGLSLITNR